MSYRTLIEINHDFASATDREFLAFLDIYLKSASRENAERLERFGVKVISLRHHSEKFVVDGTPDGFPVQTKAALTDSPSS